MTDKQRDTALKKLQEGAHFHSSSDMNADMSTEAADMVVLAVDKYIPTQNWEVSGFFQGDLFSGFVGCMLRGA